MAKIVIIETGQVYNSIAAAARAAGADPSNVRKVVRGSRSSAGGYHFAEVKTKSDIKKAQKNLIEKRKTAQKKRTYDKEKSDLVNAVHDRLIDVNKRARNAKKENLLQSDEILQKMLSHTDFYGGNKTGGYNTKKSHLRQFTTDELKNLLDLLANDQNKYYDDIYKNETKNRNLPSYALQFGISNKDMQKYWHLLPAIFELFEASKISEMRASDPVIVSEIYDAMQGDTNPDELYDYIIDLTNFYKGNTAEDLESILEKWSSTRGDWLMDWEDF